MNCREVLDQEGHREDHVGGVRVLARLAVDPRAQAKLLWVSDLVHGQPGAERLEVLATLALGPLATGEGGLKLALGDVVGDGVPRDARQ